MGKKEHNKNHMERHIKQIHYIDLKKTLVSSRCSCGVSNIYTSLHEKLFRPQANRASKPSKSTSPNFILLTRKKKINFSNLFVILLSMFFFIISNTIYPSSHTHCGYISSSTFGKSKYPACALLSDVIICMF